MTVDRTQVPPSVSIGDRDITVHQVLWSAAVQKPMNCHCELEKYPVRNVETAKFIMQYLTQAAIEFPSTSSVHHTL